MTDEKITITKSQLLSWMSSNRNGDCVWTSLKDFVQADADFWTKAPAKARTDRQAWGQRVMDIIELQGVTPYNLIWHDGSAADPREQLEVVFMSHTDRELRDRVTDAVTCELGLEDVPFGFLFSTWDGER